MEFLNLHINGVDILILAVCLFYAVEGYSVGFLVSCFDFLSFILSFVLGLKLYQFVGAFLTANFLLPQGVSHALGFFVVALFTEVLLGVLFRKLVIFIRKKRAMRLEEEQTNSLLVVGAYLQASNKIFGVIPGILSAIILLAFLLTLAIALPLSPVIKKSVSDSFIATRLVASTQGFESKLTDVFGGALNETLAFMTVRQESEEFVELHFTTTHVAIDEKTEKEMLTLLNNQRLQQGLSPLKQDNSLRGVGRAHARDMFARGYFSHYTPNGLSPFDRMTQFGIQYGFAGENLALAPNVTVAMQGLMQSPGHKANILSPNFKKVGIGVIDGGIYGEMFTQEFSD